MSTLSSGRAEMLFPHLKDGAVVLVSSQLPVGSVAALEQAFARRPPAAPSPSPARRKTCGLAGPSRSSEIPAASWLACATSARAPSSSRCCGKFCDNLIWVSVESAEMVKHALNSFLALS